MKNNIERTMATATLKNGYNGDTAQAVVTCWTRDIERAENLRVYAYHNGGTYPLGSLLDRHVESKNGLAHFLREHSQVLGFEMVGGKGCFIGGGVA